jgi:hypothetical protein
MKHKWTESSRDDDGTRTVRTCDRCGLLKISRHEWAGTRMDHWTEFWRGTERVPGDGTPVCEPVEVAA